MNRNVLKLCICTCLLFIGLVVTIGVFQWSRYQFLRSSLDQAWNAKGPFDTPYDTLTLQYSDSHSQARLFDIAASCDESPFVRIGAVRVLGNSRNDNAIRLLGLLIGKLQKHALDAYKVDVLDAALIAITVNKLWNIDIEVIYDVLADDTLPLSIRRSALQFIVNCGRPVDYARIESLKDKKLPFPLDEDVKNVFDKRDTRRTN